MNGLVTIDLSPFECAILARALQIACPYLWTENYPRTPGGLPLQGLLEKNARGRVSKMIKVPRHSLVVAADALDQQLQASGNPLEIDDVTRRGAVALREQLIAKLKRKRGGQQKVTDEVLEQYLDNPDLPKFVERQEDYLSGNLSHPTGLKEKTARARLTKLKKARNLPSDL